MAKLKTWLIYTRNQAGTTLYHLGLFETYEEAYERAIKGYGWFRVEPEKYQIISREN